MVESGLILFYAPDVKLSFRAKLLIKENPDVAEQVLAQLPMQGTLGHVVISGQAIWFPTRIVHLGRNNMVQRHPGAVYLNAVGQSLCLTYGTVTESALVNKVADVLEEDLPTLERLGYLVYEQTVTQPCRSVMTISVSLMHQKPKANGSRLAGAATISTNLDCTWRVAMHVIESQIERVWLQKPEEIEKISWGIIESGAGSGGQCFSVMVHLKSFLLHLGCDVLYRLLKVSQYDDITLRTLIRMTREFIRDNFNTFEMLTDLGLPNMHDIGTMYSNALETLSSKEQYRQLTGALFTYVCRMHRWVHFIFPWNIGVAFPHRNAKDILSLATLVSGSSNTVSLPKAE
ncbi:hypothetical protein Asppvi_009332 [Aspergillus pseudoviridinutans]|uniref:Cucumopine synthase C-terminal helical bundle domain-containing protein n=1 Tax=Aspergillus pseudoviridinutans TaxID=1517512 RepID=A0A9P3BL82_9EURO|nr:uncharacterized protein Asppvi_009332 [Aspergillus pseudoviridinutans]GIJ90378.1 hypothetical protein Asppvi_009332 [Aspergillus pseudoviridinutans]